MKKLLISLVMGVALTSSLTALAAGTTQNVYVSFHSQFSKDAKANLVLPTASGTTYALTTQDVQVNKGMLQFTSNVVKAHNDKGSFPCTNNVDLLKDHKYVYIMVSEMPGEKLSCYVSENPK